MTSSSSPFSGHSSLLCGPTKYRWQQVFRMSLIYIKEISLVHISRYETRLDLKNGSVMAHCIDN